MASPGRSIAPELAAQASMTTRRRVALDFPVLLTWSAKKQSHTRVYGPSSLGRRRCDGQALVRRLVDRRKLVRTRIGNEAVAIRHLYRSERRCVEHGIWRNDLRFGQYECRDRVNL